MSREAGRFLAACATVVAVTAAAAAGAQSASAGEVTFVDGSHVSKRNDPFVPARGADITPPRGGGKAAGARVAGVGSVGVRASRKSTKGQRAVGRVLRSARRKHQISAARYNHFRRVYKRAVSMRRRLHGTRGEQLGYVLAVTESLAITRRLTASRMNAVFLTVDRNRQYWPHKSFPANKDHIQFRGSQLVFQYYPGRGLQLQQLVNFVKANNMHGACVGARDEACSRPRYKRLLDELIKTSSRRGGFRAFEYYFVFDGGKPPWISAMAQATGIQALSRGGQLLNQPRYFKYAKAALGALRKRPPVGVRKRGPYGGTTYLQYSFAPRLYVMNAFIQTLIGLYDYNKITGSPTAKRLFDAGVPEARRQVPHSDVGDWSRYSIGGSESTGEYHALLTEVLLSICNRTKDSVFCAYGRKYRSYGRDPAKISYAGPSSTTDEKLTYLRLSLSKLSAVEVKVYKGSTLAFHKVATFRRGTRSFAWRPHSAGSYSVRLGAKELRTGTGKRSSATGAVEVGP